MLKIQENIELPQVAPEAKLLLFALSLQGAFQQTKSHQAVRAALSDPAQAMQVLRRLSQRLSVHEWRAADAEFQAAIRANIRIVSIFCPEYPTLLREICDPPFVLFCRGALTIDSPVAVVGARKASTEGLRMAFELGRILAERGKTVISGLALGIDAAAHRGALGARSAHTSTIAVLGSGVGLLQPRQNESLGERILAEGGGVISEFGVTLNAQKHYFPRRNRIIAGISTHVVIVEAAERSGSLITARLALEQGRDVSAVPGPPLSPLYAGCNALIRDGAQLLLNPQDLEPEKTAGREDFASVAVLRARSRLSALQLDTRLLEIAEKAITVLAKKDCSWEELTVVTKGGTELRVIVSLMELEGILHQRSGRYHLGEEFDTL